MNENDITEMLKMVRYWLINGADGDLTDANSREDQIERIIKLRAFLKLHLRKEN